MCLFLLILSHVTQCHVCVTVAASHAFRSIRCHTMSRLCHTRRESRLFGSISASSLFSYLDLENLNDPAYAYPLNAYFSFDDHRDSLTTFTYPRHPMSVHFSFPTTPSLELTRNYSFVLDNLTTVGCGLSTSFQPKKQNGEIRNGQKIGGTFVWNTGTGIENYSTWRFPASQREMKYAVHSDVIPKVWTFFLIIPCRSCIFSAFICWKIELHRIFYFISWKINSSFCK